jgi:uncharacterized cupredoxin-like copper-binding protein
MPKLLRLLLSVFAVLSLSAALAACGDDDDAADTEDTTTTAAAAADEGEDHDMAAEAACEGDATEVFPPSAQPATDADEVTITATETDAGGSTVYAFSENTATDLGGIGSYAVTFENQGEEMHELIVSRIKDDEQRSVADLLQAAAGGENPEDFSTDVAAGSACPGNSSRIGVDIETPGRYVVLCFFPVGSEPGKTQAELEALQGSAPPHAAQGMITEVNVS